VRIAHHGFVITSLYNNAITARSALVPDDSECSQQHRHHRVLLSVGLSESAFCVLHDSAVAVDMVIIIALCAICLQLLVNFCVFSVLCDTVRAHFNDGSNNLGVLQLSALAFSVCTG
jgi:hypothetical protein